MLLRTNYKLSLENVTSLVGKLSLDLQDFNSEATVEASESLFFVQLCFGSDIILIMAFDQFVGFQVHGFFRQQFFCTVFFLSPNLILENIYPCKIIWRRMIGNKKARQDSVDLFIKRLNVEITTVFSGVEVDETLYVTDFSRKNQFVRLFLAFFFENVVGEF